MAYFIPENITGAKLMSTRHIRVWESLKIIKNRYIPYLIVSEKNQERMRIKIGIKTGKFNVSSKFFIAVTRYIDITSSCIIV